MRYTIIIEKNDTNTYTYAYSASVLELPDCETDRNSIKEAITEVKKNIKKNTFDDNNGIIENIKGVIERIKHFIGINIHSDVVFNHLSNTTYYYTLDDKRDSHIYATERIIILIFVVLSIYGISYSISNNRDSFFTKDTLMYSTSILSILTTIWAVQSYWRLRYIDKQQEKWQPHKDKLAENEAEDEWSSPFTFHVLAESHKQWAELWFCWCVAIFTCGVTYAIFKVIDHNNQYQKIIDSNIKNKIPEIPWSTVVHDLISAQTPSGFIYLLFGVAWYWSSKHYRSHWHNFVVNAYRHRALYRLEKLRNDIRKSESKFLPNHKADETILELYRLSGVLLLIPGDSSYLDKIGNEEITKTLLQMEEITKAFTNKTANP